MDKDYNVDDILLDIKSKKSLQQGAHAAPATGGDFPVKRRGGEPGPFSEAQQPWNGDGAREYVKEYRVPDKARRSPAEPEDEMPESSNPLQFDGHVRSITDRAKMRQGRYSRATEEVTGDTSVIDFSKFRDTFHSREVHDEDSDGQTRVLPKLGAGRDLDLDEIRGMDFGEDYEGDDDDYFNEYGEDGELHRPAVDFSEYNSVEDRRDVAIDIARVKLWLFIRTACTFILTVSLFYLVLSGKYLLPLPESIAPENDMRLYLLSLTVNTVLVALAGSSAMGGGLISLFKMRSNSDSLAALAMLGAIAQCVYAAARPELAKPESLTFYCCVAALSMLFNALGKMSMISRIQANFKIISSDKPKKAVIMADDEVFTREFLGGARRPSIAIGAKCDFFTDFLALSYSDKYDVGINRAVTPVCMLGAGVVGALTYILTKGDSMMAVTALTGILCVAATLSATFIENVPLAKLTKKLAPKGGMVSSNKAVEDFCDVSAVVLGENDLFPKGHVEVHGIKSYSQGRVDEAILDAVSVMCAADSAASSTFLQMIGGNRRLIKKVDNWTYEDGRGIVAWLDGRRVLIGNRKLMQSHGVAVPNYEQKKDGSQGEVVFLASAGELSAQFTVNYKIDEELAVELDRMAALEKTIIIHTVDSNLSAHKVWELYGYPEELVRIMPAGLHEQYRKMTAPRESELAEVACTGRASAMVGAVLACSQARSSILSATVVQLIQIALGYGLITLTAFLGAISTVTVPALCAYQAFWFVVIWLIQKLKTA